MRIRLEAPPMENPDRGYVYNCYKIQGLERGITLMKEEGTRTVSERKYG